MPVTFVFLGFLFKEIDYYLVEDFDMTVSSWVVRQRSHNFIINLLHNLWKVWLTNYGQLSRTINQDIPNW